ncbi:DNA ligase D [Legionella sp. PC997]|uniref:DNA ligase D n=1 Tax=Legionella sp. PC997 TaxID=2755562 RepID=UPI0015FD8843|nr:DNA ligase D [Legionella sp. PC997]QMT62063.1 Multifunctional non-homologous end joining protein LigD [Legionella sp. PC997]
MGLEHYHQKRDFSKTPEPKGKIHHRNYHRFVIQMHKASHLHYDFRMELDGVLKSWAIPKGPCLDPDVKRLAMHTEDHPVEYLKFEGFIPKGEYGSGRMIIWDTGKWEPIDEDPLKAYNKGHLRFILHAKKLGGRWDIFKIRGEGTWFLKKYDDDFARPLESFDITEKEPQSVVSGLKVEEIRENVSSQAPRKRALFKGFKLDLPESPFPQSLSPQLATLAKEAPEGNEWIHEIKYDGYRMLAFKEGSSVRMMSRNHKNWTKEFRVVADAIAKLPIKNLLLDGELVILDEESRPNFQLMQNSIKGRTDKQFIYYLFDIVYYDKWNLCSLPLLKRKEILKSLIPDFHPIFHYSPHIVGSGNEVYEKACAYSLEGIISKLALSTYQTKRTKTWLKLKCTKKQEFVIGGYTPPQGSRTHLGSLYLGYYNSKGDLIYCGNVGTGFSAATLREVTLKLNERISPKNPFSLKNPPGYKTAIWVKPELVCEVEYIEWTSEGILRHPSFKGLREDINANQVTKEEAKSFEEINRDFITQENLQPTKHIRLTHPEKILYPEDGITKQMVFDYYEHVCNFMLPHIQNRPLTLVRCPSDYKECFYQKMFNKSSSKELQKVSIESPKDHEISDYMYLTNREGLLGLAQMGVLEIHPWGSQVSHLKFPDVLIFDLDPSPEVPWSRVVESAFEVRQFLKEFNLTSFVKTTGGKGLHVVVPIKPEHNWDVIKEFTHSFVETLEKIHPNHYVSEMSKAKRVGKIFIDYLRNQWDAAIGPYSTRARPHAPVATPIHWDELTNNIEDTFYNIFTIQKRLNSLRVDPWKDIWLIGKKQSLNLDDKN